MPSTLLLLLYRGDRQGAQALASTSGGLDIFEAAALGALEALIERCEEDAASVNAYSDDGWTPLHFAAYFGHNACAKDLLRRGAFVDARARNGSAATPLHSACAGNHPTVAQTLLSHGADVDAVQTGGHRPLDSALQNANAELAEVLRAAGGKPGDPGAAQPP